MLSIIVKEKSDLLHLPEKCDFFVMFDESFDKSINLPNRIKELKLNSKYDRHLIFPEGLTHLILGSKYCQDLQLPNSLLHLKIGNGYKNHLDKIPKKLPPNLTHLILCCDYPVDNLPNSLTHLTIEYSNYNKSLNNLPHSLEYLNLGEYFSGKIDNLPPNLKLIEYSFCCHTKIKEPFGCRIRKVE